MKIKLIFSVLWLMVVSPPLVMAEPPHLRYGPGEINNRWAREDSIFSTLNLTSKQQEMIQDLREALERDIAPLHAEKYERIAELKLLWSDRNLDRQKLKARVKELHDHLWRIIEIETDYRLAFRGILTQDQYSKFLSETRFGRFSRK